jgi:hypothetical protein
LAGQPGDLGADDVVGDHTVGRVDDADEASLVSRRTDHRSAVEHDREIGAVPTRDVLDGIEQDLALHLEPERWPAELGHVVAIDDDRRAGANEVLGGGLGVARNAAGKWQRPATRRPSRTLAVGRRTAQGGQLLGEILREGGHARQLGGLDDRGRPVGDHRVTDTLGGLPGGHCSGPVGFGPLELRRGRRLPILGMTRFVASIDQLGSRFDVRLVSLDQIGAQLVDLIPERHHPRLECEHLDARPRGHLFSRLAFADFAVQLGRGTGPSRLVRCVGEQPGDSFRPASRPLQPHDPDRVDEVGQGTRTDPLAEHIVGLHDATHRTERRCRQPGHLHVRLEGGWVLERRTQLLTLPGHVDGELQRAAQVTMLERARRHRRVVALRSIHHVIVSVGPRAVPNSCS